MLASLTQDIRYGLRAWRRRPWFTAALIGMLALGIAATTSVFALAYAELWQPSLFVHPEQLVQISAQLHGVQINLNAAEFQALKAAPGFQGSAAAIFQEETWVHGGRAENLSANRITPNLLPLLGVRPQLGRNFLPSEAATGHDAEALISASLWRSHFGASAEALGQTLQLDGRLYTIIGVMPQLFQFGNDGGDAVWTPAVFSAAELAANGPHNLQVTARLASGLSWQEEQPRLKAFSEGLHLSFRGTTVSFVGTTFAFSRQHAPGRTPLLALLAAVGLVLLIACANVAGLLLARSASREREMSVRQALGASRTRIIMQLLTEGALLAVAAAGLGLVLADWGISVLRASPLSGELFRLQQARLDPAVLGFAVATALACTLLFSLAPALHLARPMAAAAVGRGSARLRLRNLFLVAEVALTLTLLVGAGLAAKSLVTLETENTGMDLHHLAAIQFQFTPQQAKQPAIVAALAARVRSTLRGRPGWRQVAITDQAPYPLQNARLFSIAPAATTQFSLTHAIAPDYFTTVGQRILAGRNFSATDNAAAPGVVIVNQVWVHEFLHGQSPLGVHLTWTDRGAKAPSAHTIVGVASDARDLMPYLPARPEIYTPYTQSSSSMLALMVNAGNPAAAVSAVRAILGQAMPDLVIAEAQPLGAYFSDAMALPRFQQLFLIGFSGLALLFALSGIWALVAYAVAERQREFGIRMALGAQAGDILRQALRPVTLLTAIGIALGLTGAWVATRLMASLLFGVQPTDPAIFAAVTVLFALIALAAAYWPARRALASDPAATLRCE